MSYPSLENQFLQPQALLICESYCNYFLEDLVESGDSPGAQAEALFYAPFAVLSHTVDPDPVFNYANLQALSLFGYSWEELIGLPSRLSAEPVCQQDRDKLLKEVSQNGFIKNYQGVRLAKNGDRFLIKGARVWNLARGKEYAGQAACLKAWELL